MELGTILYTPNQLVVHWHNSDGEIVKELVSDKDTDVSSEEAIVQRVWTAVFGSE